MTEVLKAKTHEELGQVVDWFWDNVECFIADCKGATITDNSRARQWIRWRITRITAQYARAGARDGTVHLLIPSTSFFCQASQVFVPLRECLALFSRGVLKIHAKPQGAATGKMDQFGCD